MSASCITCARPPKGCCTSGGMVQDAEERLLPLRQPWPCRRHFSTKLCGRRPYSCASTHDASPVRMRMSRGQEWSAANEDDDWSSECLLLTISVAATPCCSLSWVHGQETADHPGSPAPKPIAEQPGSAPPHAPPGASGCRTPAIILTARRGMKQTAEGRCAGAHSRG